MIFLGDIAVPNSITPTIDYLPKCFSQPVIANLEGAITKDNSVSTTETKLFNSENVVAFLNRLNVKIVTLGNNHITDVPAAFDFTKETLAKVNIAHCGAGDDLEEARKPAIIDIDGEQYAFLSFGWNVISCKYAGSATVGCNPLEAEWVLECIKTTKYRYPKAKIIILPHWNYELERYPQPMHRKLARLAIDAGVVAVVGHHPHCVQGIEFYKGAPIIYSLGNWFIPDNIYFDKRLKFPDIAKLQLAIELNNGVVRCHWFKYCAEDNRIEYIESSSPTDCRRINELTPFSDMNHEEYIKWFKINRRKRKGLPIYKNPNDYIINLLKTKWVLARQNIISLMMKMRIKKGPS